MVLERIAFQSIPNLGVKKGLYALLTLDYLKKGIITFDLKHKLPIWIIGAFVLVGIMVEWFLSDPVHGKALFTQVMRGNLMVGIMGILLLGVPVLVGWLYVMFGKDQLKPRLHWFWTPFGLLMFAWAWSTFYGATVLEGAGAITVNAFLTTSPEVWRCAAVGLLFAFYELESAVPLWYFYWMWFIAGITQGPGMLLTDLLPVLLGLPRLPSGYLQPEQVGKFWTFWGFFFLDLYLIPLGLVAGYFIIKWRRSVLEKEGRSNPIFLAILQGVGLPFVLLWQGLKKGFKK